MKIILFYLLIINALGFALMLTDKQKARKNKWRIPEATLLGVALLGGSIGIWCGIYTARHKTKKPAFFIGVPLILLLQIAAIIFLITKSDIL